MDEEDKKFLMIAVAAVAVVIVGTMLYRSISGGGLQKPDTGTVIALNIALKCSDCGTFEISTMNDIIRKNRPPMSLSQHINFDCFGCGKK